MDLTHIDYQCKKLLHYQYILTRRSRYHALSSLWFLLLAFAFFSLQLCRYLFYQGKIKTIHLEYTDAKDCLLQAAKKGPTTAVGFQIQCTKWAVIVHLLLGEIPERTIFTQKRMEKALGPYFELTNVSIG